MMTVPSTLAAAQHAPRPLPLFLHMLRSETHGDPVRRAAALAGLQAYQAAPRSPRAAPMPVIATAGRASLRDYGGAPDGAPVVFVPSLINPPFVLDLAPDASLLRWLAARGHRAMLVDWGTPTAADREQDIAAHVETMLLPMLRTLRHPPILAGYCLGGTIALAAAQRLPAAGLILLAAPWRFAAFGDEARAGIVGHWERAASACETLGLVPMEVLQAVFWGLDPARTIAKFEAFAALDPAGAKAAAFVALEDWANAGAPLSLAAGRDLFTRLFGADDPGRAAWAVAGAVIDPALLTCPVLDIVSTRDRIVPAASSAAIGTRIAVDAGHVGMVVGSRARSLVWEPLADWLTATAAIREPAGKHIRSPRS